MKVIPRWIVLGNPENRRIALFQAALGELHQQPASVLSYRDVLTGEATLAEVLAQNADKPCVLRIESPGEDHGVERLLIARGATGTAEDTISADAARRMRFDAGRVRHSRQWFAGYSALLDEIETALHAFPNVRVQNSPAAIRLLFDKPRCHAHLASRGIAVPPVLENNAVQSGPLAPRAEDAAIGLAGTASVDWLSIADSGQLRSRSERTTISGYDALRTAMQTAGCRRVFVKLASGSSASGVVAFSTAGTKSLAITSLEMVRVRGESRFYNNLQLSRYSRERDLRALFDFLGREGVHVEAWLPKASQAGRNFDLRIVTIAGRPCHAVVRTSRSPITNLHLGNRRGDLAALQQAAGAQWSVVTDLCEQATGAVPAALYVGWDVLVTPDFRRAYILEGNAFGDLLPGVLHEGRSTYAQSIRAVLAENGRAS